MPRVQLLLTRPEAASLRFQAEVEDALGHAVPTIVSPLLRVVPQGRAPDLHDAAGVIFTSQAGVAAFAHLGGRARGVAWCVGARTGAAAADLGFDVAGVAQDADGLVALVPPDGGPLIHLHGRFTRGDIVPRLQARGVTAVGACVYDQLAQPLQPTAIAALRGRGPICAPLFSPRTAELLAQALPSPVIAPVFAIVMSDAVGKALGASLGFSVQTAPTPTGSAMVEAVVNRLRGAQPT